MKKIDKEILNRFKSGDYMAFREIYMRSSLYVYNIAYRILGNSEDADEVSQEVYVRLFRNIKKYKFESEFTTWLYRIAYNTSLDFLKNRKRAKLLKEEKYNVSNNENLDYTGDTSVIFDLEKKLLTLKPKYRSALILKSIIGLSYEEISRVMNIRLNTVRTLIKRAREQLLSGGKNEL